MGVAVIPSVCVSVVVRHCSPILLGEARLLGNSFTNVPEPAFWEVCGRLPMGSCFAKG